MARIAWDQVGERRYETGVDRGVLYLPDEDGVPWNGLTSVVESPTGGEVNPHYLDGVKYTNHIFTEEFEATIEAFSKPDEFNQCEGLGHYDQGLFLGQQPKKSFGLSYRTLIGDDVEGTDRGYKIHLVYNATVIPAEKTYQTIGQITEVANFSWAIKTRADYFPYASALVSHIVLDTRYMGSGMTDLIEEDLYGTDTSEPFLPDFQHLYTMFTPMTPS